MQMRFIDINDATVSEVHEFICDTAVEVANGKASQDTRLPKKWRGPVFMNSSPYNQGALVLEIVEEYQLAPPQARKIYQEIAKQSVQEALVRHKKLFVGLILGSAKSGRNYFDQWSQAPSQLF
jgi:hypothetical protein